MTEFSLLQENRQVGAVVVEAWGTMGAASPRDQGRFPGEMQIILL